MEIDTESPLEKAVRLAAGQSALAREATKHSLNPGQRLTQKRIWKWLNRARGPVPTPEWAIPIELAVEGRVSRYELCPHVFGPAPEEVRQRSLALEAG